MLIVLMNLFDGLVNKGNRVCSQNLFLPVPSSDSPHVYILIYPYSLLSIIPYGLVLHQIS